MLLLPTPTRPGSRRQAPARRRAGPALGQGRRWRQRQPGGQPSRSAAHRHDTEADSPAGHLPFPRALSPADRRAGFHGAPLPLLVGQEAAGDGPTPLDPPPGPSCSPGRAALPLPTPLGPSPAALLTHTPPRLLQPPARACASRCTAPRPGSSPAAAPAGGNMEPSRRRVKRISAPLSPAFPLRPALPGCGAEPAGRRALPECRLPARRGGSSRCPAGVLGEAGTGLRCCPVCTARRESSPPGQGIAAGLRLYLS